MNAAERARADAILESISAEILEVYTVKFMAKVREELKRARGKFPSPQCSFVALTEEVGELAKALLDEPVDRIEAEAIQVAVMAIRVGTEGDPSIHEYRARKMAQEGK